MKNQFIVKSLKLALTFVFILFVSSCSDDNETLNTTDQLNAKTSDAQILAKGGKSAVKVAASGLFSYSTTTVCLGDDLTVIFDNLYGDDSDCGEIQIQYSLNGIDWVQLGKGTVTDGVFSVTFTPVEGAYSFRADFNGKAGGCKEEFESMKFQDNTVNDVVVVGECCDDESFNVEATNDNLDLLFTYDAETTLFDAEVKFTFSQVLNHELNGDGKYEAPDGKEYAVNNPTNQTVFTWVGDIGCTDEEAETFSFSHEPDCGKGNAKDGEAVIWTDMKVNEISVKPTDVSNIKYTLCPL